MNGTVQDEISAYVEAVRAALTDLPDATREELLDDLPEHLAEVLAESTGTGSLADRLGSPQAYAAELRRAAGFVGGFPEPPPPPDRIAALWAVALRELTVLDRRVGPLLGQSRASLFLAQLRPAWWVLRGYLAAMLLAYLLDDSGQPIGLLPRIGGSEVVALLLLAAMILGSVWLGRRTAQLAPWPRYALRAGTVLLALVAVGGFFDADSSSRGSTYQDVNYNNPYNNVQDVFVYDEQGRLLTGVRLFDQNGQPIHLGWRECQYREDLPADSQTQMSHDMIDGVYPYCPQSAPFRMPSAVTPSSSAPSSAVPSSSVTPTSQPSVSAAVPSPSVSVSASPVPSPSATR